MEAKPVQSLVHEHTVRAEVEAAQQRLTFLAEASSVLASSLDYEATLTNVVHLMVPTLADWCVLDLLAEDGTIQRVATAHADPQQEELAQDMRRRYPRTLQAEDASIISRVLRTGKAVIVPDISPAHLQRVARDAEHLRLLLLLSPKCDMCVPLVARGRTLGAISFRSVQSGQRYGPEDLVFAEELARRAAPAVDNARLYKVLQQSQQMLQLVLNNIPQSVFWKDRDSVYLGCNAVFAHANGLRPEDVVGMTEDQMTATPEEAQWFRLVDRRVMERNQPEYHIIEQVHRPGGRVAWLETNKIPLHDTAGKVVGVLGTYTDITERRQVEEALRENEEKYRTLFEESRDAILIYSQDGTSLDVNHSVLTLFGYTREEMSRLNVQALYAHPEDWERYRQALAAKGSLRDYEVQLRRKDGTPLDCLITVSMWRATDGSVRGYQAIIRDVTEHKRLEAQLRQAQKMEAIGTLAGGIAHDFNNILTAVLGYTELALLDTSPERMAWRNLQAVLAAGQRARDLVQQILTFSRRSDQKYQPVQLHLVVQEALKLLRASLPMTIAIQQYIDPTAGTILADATQMHQVLMNLCNNAEHAMREASGVLEVRLESILVTPEFATVPPPLQSGPHVRLTVRDTGHGIGREHLERIFEPFFTTKGVGEGTGLGLSVVHGIIARHGGAITVQSTPGQGTTFEIYLPRIDTSTGHEAATEEPIPRGTERILFVEDEEALAWLWQQMLTRLGYKVVMRTSSLEALEAFRAAPQDFDLVITDQTMPQMTGGMLAQELLRLRPDIPIILCTGFSHTMNAETAQKLGIQAYLLKPLVMRDFGLTIRRVLHK